MNFRSKTRGLYEIIEPVLEENEVFDSSLLKESIDSLIASGKRNFAFDMSPLDYIYSDTINMLMAMNRRVLDVTGRLSLLTPQPEVLQILKRAGIHNILRIFATETELIKSSEDMMLQTTGINVSDVNAAIGRELPQPEFDRLRFETGSVFGSRETAPPAAQQAPMTHQSRSAGGDDFNRMFQQLEPRTHVSGRGGFRVPPVQPQVTLLQPPKFQPRRFQQPAAQPIPLRPASPLYPRQPMEVPKVMPDYPVVRSETLRFTTAPGTVPFQEQCIAEPAKPFPQEELSFDLSPNGAGPKQPGIRDDFDSMYGDGLHRVKKRSPLPVVIIVILLAIGGSGGFMIYSTIAKTKTTPEVRSNPQNQNPVPPERVVAPAPVPAPVPAADTSKPKPPRPRPRPAPAPSAKPPETIQPVNQIVFTSVPIGAAVTINDERRGITPYTWTKPFFGKVEVQISKTGFKTALKSFEFTGGISTENFNLEKETVAVAPVPPVVVSTPPEDDPFVNIETEPGSEPEPTPPPPVGTGGEALIFIASIPPVADIYLGDKHIGKTNVADVKIPAGLYTLKFVKGTKETTKQFNLQAGKNPSQFVRLP